jgi:hypothetical protein
MPPILRFSIPVPKKLIAMSLLVGRGQKEGCRAAISGAGPPVAARCHHAAMVIGSGARIVDRAHQRLWVRHGQRRRRNRGNRRRRARRRRGRPGGPSVRL